MSTSTDPGQLSMLDGELAQRTRHGGVLGRLKAGLVGQVLILLAFGTLLVGILLVLLQRSLTAESATRDLVGQFGTTLATFGFTTLLITWFASQNLQRQLLSKVSEQMDGHVRDVRQSMDVSTSHFQERITQFVPLFGNCTRYGLENVYLTRTDALCDFGDHLSEELKEAGSSKSARMLSESASSHADESDGERVIPRLWIVSSSMEGIRKTTVSKSDGPGGFDGTGILKWAGSLAADGLLDLRILMTHPAYADYRAAQEQRGRGAIPHEIGEALTFLTEDCKVPTRCIRMVQATPTVFAIATKTRMLLNPYPYSAEAFRSFTLTVRKAHVAPNDQHEAIHRDIFEQYEHRHFNVPWSKGMKLHELDLTAQAGPVGGGFGAEIDNAPQAPELAAGPEPAAGKDGRRSGS